jgi:hypothetical protein
MRTGLALKELRMPVLLSKAPGGMPCTPVNDVKTIEHAWEEKLEKIDESEEETEEKRRGDGREETEEHLYLAIRWLVKIKF